MQTKSFNIQENPVDDRPAALKKPPGKLEGALLDNSTLFGGRVRITAFGRFYNNPEQEEDWTFRNLRTQEDTSKDTSLSRNLLAIAQSLGVYEILAPSPVDFNAKVCWQKDLNQSLRIGNKLVVRRGTNADGCRLDVRQAFAISSAGCATIVACYPGDAKSGEKVKIDVAHAGLKSLIDEQEAMTGLTSRTPPSVIENMLTDMKCSGTRTSRRKRVRVTVVLPIPWEEFVHPQEDPVHGERNKKLLKYLHRTYGKSVTPGEEANGHIDLAELITRQCTELGIPHENVGLILASDCVSTLRHTDGKELWYSTRGTFRDRRNLVMVSRYA